MKKVILFILIVLPIHRDSYSQNFEFGIKTGIVISDIELTDLVTSHINPDKPDIWFHYFTPKLGFNISLTFDYNLNSKFAFRMEPGYILKGANFSNSDSKLDLHYLNLPLTVQYKIGEKTGIYLGSEFSHLINAKLDFDGIEINMDDFYNKKTEISIFMGLNYFITKGFGLGARLNYGLTKVSETVWTDETGNLIGICKENNIYFLMYITLKI